MAALRNLENSKNKTKILYIILTQAMVLLFSLVSILSKVAAGMLTRHGLLSIQFLAVMGSAVLFLAVYAFFWQKILKHTELSIAYLSKGVGLFWTLLWSVLIFKETVTVMNVLAVVLIVIGIIVINLGQIREGEGI